MSRPEVWLVIVLSALVTLAERGAFLITTSRRPLPPLLQRALRYVPAAVFAAITLPALTRPSGVGLGPLDVRLLAGLVAGVVAWRTRNVTLTFVVGMALLWLLSWALA
ncbi:MAG TPA: AzlD domain-containing protein [Trueperaceae bacterium]|nr:AzlD domain-containing protein [Trueperaceae bacterium]